MSLTIEPLNHNQLLSVSSSFVSLAYRKYYQQCSAYTNSSLLYRERICRDDDIHCKDESFVIKIDHKIVFVFIGIKTIKQLDLNINAYSGRPCALFFNEKLLTKKSLNLLFDKLNEFTSEDNIKLHYRDFLLQGNISPLSRHLLSIGAHTQNHFTYVIDLEQSVEILKRDIRKSYMSLINWGLRELKPFVHSKDTNFSWSDMKSFRDLHTKVSGRNTRSERSWRRQYEMVLAGEAFIVIGKFDNNLVSAGFFTNSKDSCYYGASASKRDLFEKPIFHSLMWIAILHAKSIGCKWFEVGEQLYPEIGNPTQKEIGISQFKAGFGGTIKTFIDIKLSKKLGKK